MIDGGVNAGFGEIVVLVDPHGVDDIGRVSSVIADLLRPMPSFLDEELGKRRKVFHE
jgi:hypothetical protein